MGQPSPLQIKLEGLKHHDSDSHSWLGDSGYQTRSPDAKVLRNLAVHSSLAHVLPATRISLTKVGQGNARLELHETHKKLRFAVLVMTALQRGLECRRLVFFPSSSISPQSLPFHDFSSCGTHRFPDQASTVNIPCKSNQFFSVWTWIQDYVPPSSCLSLSEERGKSHWLPKAPLVRYEPGSLKPSQTSAGSLRALQDYGGLHEHPV